MAVSHIPDFNHPPAQLLRSVNETEPGSRLPRRLELFSKSDLAERIFDRVPRVPQVVYVGESHSTLGLTARDNVEIGAGHDLWTQPSIAKQVL